MNKNSDLMPNETLGLPIGMLQRALALAEALKNIENMLRLMKLGRTVELIVREGTPQNNPTTEIAREVAQQILETARDNFKKDLTSIGVIL